MNPPLAQSFAMTPEAVELAARHELGQIRGVFTPKRLSKPLFVLYAFTLVQLLFLLVLPGLLFYWWLRKTPNFSRRQAAKRLCLFEHGMIVHPQSGDGLVAVRWDSVRLYQEVTQMIVNGIPAPAKYAFTATAPGGVQVRMTEFYDGPETWGPWMQDAIVRAQYAARKKDVLAGGTVDFSALTVTSGGLGGTAQGRLAWSEVTDIAVRGGRVYVMKAGQARPWWDREAVAVANLQLFLTIAKDFTSRN